MSRDTAIRVRVVRERLAKARVLKRMIREAPDQLRRDAAIITYSRTLDLLVADLNALDEMGLLAACVARLEPPHGGVRPR